MDTEATIAKKAQSFRLPVALIERLKVMAKKENRSLNNFVECALLEFAYKHTPNAETRQSIDDARQGKNEGELNLKSVETFFASMGL